MTICNKSIHYQTKKASSGARIVLVSPQLPLLCGVSVIWCHFDSHPGHRNKKTQVHPIREKTHYKAPTANSAMFNCFLVFPHKSVPNSKAPNSSLPFHSQNRPQDQRDIAKWTNTQRLLTRFGPTINRTCRSKLARARWIRIGCE